MTEFYPDLTDKVVLALHKFVALANTMLNNDGQGVEAWTATRWEDFVITLQWYVRHLSVYVNSYMIGYTTTTPMATRIFCWIL